MDLSESTLLGRGSFAKVLEGKWNGDTVAIKRFHHKSILQYTIIREMWTLYSLRHPCILSPLHIGMDKKGPFILTRKYDSTLSSTSPTTHVVSSLLHALAYLHSKQYIHRDIKHGNIFIHSTGVVLGDVGTCRHLGSQNTRPLSANVSSPYIRAPEMQHRKTTYSYASDMYSLGIVLQEIGLLDDRLASLVHPDPLCRPTAESLLQYYPFTGFGSTQHPSVPTTSHWTFLDPCTDIDMLCTTLSISGCTRLAAMSCNGKTTISFHDIYCASTYVWSCVHFRHPPDYKHWIRLCTISKHVLEQAVIEFIMSVERPSSFNDSF